MFVLRSEAATLAGFITLLGFVILGDSLVPERVGFMPAMLLLLLLFAVMMWCAFSVVRHAECLALPSPEASA